MAVCREATREVSVTSVVRERTSVSRFDQFGWSGVCREEKEMRLEMLDKMEGRVRSV